MKKFFTNKRVAKDCKIYSMLKEYANKRHISFHTPGHKIGKWDITELSFSDNLSCPTGVIAQAQGDIAEILGAEKSFIVTDGSTCGILSMLYAAKLLGVKTVGLFSLSHKSVFNGCAALALTPIVFPSKTDDEPPSSCSLDALKNQHFSRFIEIDALLVTSPDYYGNVAPLQELAALCKKHGKLLLVDGAHGGHLHFDKEIYAGTYADLWVDGVHKSLPALTQGAVVSAKTKPLADALEKAVDIFRTSSPSYPIMASVEYAVKYPENAWLKKEVFSFAQTYPTRMYQNGDWTKLCVYFGQAARQAKQLLEKQNIYVEFCDGAYLVFYLSPATTKKQFSLLKKRLDQLFAQFPVEKGQKKLLQRIPAPILFDKTTPVKWVDLHQSEGEICAQTCGLFPPCLPLIAQGERIEKENILRLQQADNVFGLQDGKIAIYTIEENE